MVPDLNGPSVMVCKDTNYYLIYNKIFYGAAGSRFMGACLALVITEMDRNYRSITEIFFLLEVCLLGLLEVACLGWRSITETFLASLEIWVLV